MSKMDGRSIAVPIIAANAEHWRAGITQSSPRYPEYLTAHEAHTECVGNERTIQCIRSNRLMLGGKVIWQKITFQPSPQSDYTNGWVRKSAALQRRN